MFDVSGFVPTDHPDPDHASDAQAQPGARKMDSLMARMSDPGGQRIFLPRGSAQSRFEPPSYYYDASDSGVVPRWAVDEACRK